MKSSGLFGVTLLGALAFAPASAFAQAASAQASDVTPPAKAVAPPAKATDAASKPAPAGSESDALMVRYPPSSARWKILIAGIAVTGVAYGGVALMGALWEGIPAADMHYIPVAGPWIALGNSGCAPSEETTPGEGDCEALIGVRAAIYVVDGLLQLGGLGLVVQSIAMTTESSEPAVKKATILPMPMITPTSVGFGVGGTF